MGNIYFKGSDNCKSDMSNLKIKGRPFDNISAEIQHKKRFSVKNHFDEVELIKKSNKISILQDDENYDKNMFYINKN